MVRRLDSRGSEAALEEYAAAREYLRPVMVGLVECRGAARALLLEGLPEMPIQKIRLENIFISARRGAQAIDADQVEMKEVKIWASEGPAFKLVNSRNVTLQKPSGRPGSRVLLRLEGKKTRHIRIAGANPQEVKSVVEKDAAVGDEVFIQP